MKILKSFCILLLLAVTSCATDATNANVSFSGEPVYDYPINNPYAATIIGVPRQYKIDYSSVPKLKDREVTIFPDRKIPEGFWYQRGLKYSQLLQPNAAPVAYVISGTGADQHADKMHNIANILYSAGISVVLLPSPTHPNFIINAGENFTPGRPAQDAEDLYRVIEIIDRKVRNETTVTGHMLAGYSLGALDAAFTAKLDDEQHIMNFSKVLLINPPYNLYNSVKRIDDMLYSALPNGLNDADKFVKSVVARISSVAQNTDALDFSNETLLLDAYEKYQPTDDRLASIIGLSFRISAANMVFTSDVMAHSGYIFPKDREFTTSTHLNDYMSLALRTSLGNYFDEIYAERYMTDNAGLTKQGLVSESSLESLAPYISGNKKFKLITNKDDVILAPGEADKLGYLFGDNAVIFNNGGHVGNLAHPSVAYYITKFVRGE